MTTLQTEFNQLSNTLEDSTIEYWYARDLQKVLGYNSWDKFQNVIEKAKIACENSGVEVADHFRQVGKMVQIGSEAMRKIEDIILTRYACYLIAQNGQ
ncbi:MAG: BRO family protein [Sulfurimonas sp.]|uniref:BRO family protein n=1 Tax=Sulfurimonas sp. TaxID=2022749 RepID=UPI00356632DF